jgi:hypothetical protein
VNPAPVTRRFRIAAAASALSVAATFLAAQVDFARRHRIGISPERYWKPQLTRIWLPGLATALVLAVIAFVLHRRDRDA